MTLAYTIYLSFLGSLVVLLMPPHRVAWIRCTALAAATGGLALALMGCASLARQGFPVEIVNVAWVPVLGISYHLSADGVSGVLVLLTGIAAVAGVLFSWNVERRLNQFFALYLSLIGGVYGVFLSADLFLIFVFYEIAIIPKYFLIAIWGSTRREYGAMKLALYSFVGSAMVLLGLLAAYVEAGADSFDLSKLASHPYPVSFQRWVYPLVFLGFGILAGLWPFHTWAPTGHVAAPTAASMLLAGVVMKLGAYGCWRVAMTLFPSAVRNYAALFAGMATMGIVYGALVALVQKDFKFVIGYSSVSHMGFVLLGLMSLNTVGLSGSIFQMFSHGVIAGLLFGVVGRMVYDRTHQRDLEILQSMDLHRLLPFAATTFALAGFASMGLPGFSGFVAELQILIGAWRSYPVLVLLSGLGILVGAAYSLRALQKAFYGKAWVAGVPHTVHTLPPMTWPERAGALLLLASTVVAGLFPGLLLQLIEPAIAVWLAGQGQGGGL